jgi:hypothetical protein
MTARARAVAHRRRRVGGKQIAKYPGFVSGVNDLEHEVRFLQAARPWPMVGRPRGFCSPLFRADSVQPIAPVTTASP